MSASHASDAIVVGLESNGLGVARALAKEGIPVTAVTGPSWDPSWYTRCVRRVIKCREWSAECLLETLLALGKGLPSPAPLLITKDESVLWISSARNDLRENFRFTLPNDETVQLLMSKIRFEEYAREQNWPMPRSWSFSNRDEVRAHVDSIPYPCILKVAIKNTEFRRNSPSKAFKIADRAELIDTYDMVGQWEPDVIVQEWIGGGDDRVTYGLGYWNAEAKPLALFAGQKLRQWPPECGGTAIAAPAPEQWADSIRSLTARIMEHFQYQGLGSIEFKMRADGSPVIIEPTVGRTNYQNEVAVLNGVNIPAAAYYDLTGQVAKSLQWERPKAGSRSVKLIDSAGDTLAARQYIAAGKLTHEEWRRSRSGPRKFMVFRLDDPGPFAMLVMRRAAGAVRRRLARLQRTPLKRR